MPHDFDVKTLLDDWGLGELEKRFMDAGFDEDLFLSLEVDDFEGLFNPSEMGWKLRFKKSFSNWKNNYKPPTLPPLEMHAPRGQRQSSEPTPDVRVNPVPPRNADAPAEPENNVSSLGSGYGFFKMADLLDKTWEGHIILANFERTEEVKMRNLSRLIIINEFERLKRPKISTERFTEIAQELVKIFKKPNNFIEADDFYWPSTKTKSSGGPLYYRYTKYRRLLIEEKIIKRHDMSVAEKLIFDDDEHIQWLKENDEPLRDVLAHWQASYFSRENVEMNAGQKNLLAYYLEFPIIQRNVSYKLLLLDFKHLYPEADKKLMVLWPKICSLICNAAKSYPVDSELWEFLLENERSSVAAFLVLPGLFGVCRRKKRTVNWGINLQEVLKSFILIVESREAYQKHLEHRDTLNNLVRGQTLPFIAVIGKLENEGLLAENLHRQTEEDPTYYDKFITILIHISKDLVYNLESKSLLEAVDVLFKIYVILKIDFAPECGNIWAFLKHYIYGIDLDCCSKYTTVIQFVKKHLLLTLNDLKARFDEENMSVDDSDDE